MTGFEPANNEVTIHCLNHLATPATSYLDCNIFIDFTSTVLIDNIYIISFYEYLLLNFRD
jgi:hypothetical protein